MLSGVIPHLTFDGFVREAVANQRLVLVLSENATADDPARTEMIVILRPADRGTEQEFHQTGVVNDEHFEALKGGTRCSSTNSAST